ncbi:hypothetical protein HYS47_01165 [Candidatus Woesearchaeota archaeon]|nr:hypothetical protein [Candidatus Woesearchaeota archaeon]
MEKTSKKILLGVIRGILYLLITLFFRASALFSILVVAVMFTAAPNDSLIAKAFPFFAFACIFVSGILTTLTVSMIDFLSPVKPTFQKGRCILFLVIFLLPIVITTSTYNVKSLPSTLLAEVLYAGLADVLSAGGTLYLVYRFRHKFRK